MLPATSTTSRIVESASGPAPPSSPSQHNCVFCADTSRFPIYPERCPYTGERIHLLDIGTTQEILERRPEAYDGDDEFIFQTRRRQGAINRYSGLVIRIEEWIERCRRMKCIGFMAGWDVDREGEDQDGWRVEVLTR
jgi:hypothetical protein